MDILHKLIHIAGFDQISVLHVLLYSLIPVAVLFAEAGFLGWEKSSLRILISNSRSAQGDLWCFVLGLTKVFDLIGLILTFGITYAIIVLADKKLHAHLFFPIENTFLRVLVLLLITDLKNYVRHYLFHKIEWMWQLHKYHHSANVFTVLTALRGSFVESAVSRIFDAIPFIVLGAFPEEFIFVNALRETQQYLLHAQLQSTWGMIGKYILVSPAAHRIHHSTEEQFFGKNFGTAFIFWDRIFGTYQKPQPVEEIGLKENDFKSEGFFHDQWISYLSSLKSLKKIILRNN